MRILFGLAKKQLPKRHSSILLRDIKYGEREKEEQASGFDP